MLQIPKVPTSLWDFTAFKVPMETAIKAFPYLPTVINDAKSLSTIGKLKKLYTTTDPLISGTWMCLVLMIECYVWSLITGNYSQVDKQWSIVPFVYAWNFAIHANPLLLHNIFYPASSSVSDWINGILNPQNYSNPRLIVAAIIATMWGLRLTYNFWRKGGYTDHGEDYRWIEMRKRLPSWTFQLLNITFIATYQHALLFSLTFPLWICYKVGFTGWNWVDLLATGGYVFLLTFETIADQQQWIFQNKKYAVRNGEIKLKPNDPDTDDIQRGFLTRGLFSISRHPNFFAEMSMWWMYYLYSVAATGQWLNWSVVGTFLLTGLFQGSTIVTEYFSISKYPVYKVYQQRVSRFIPWFPSNKPAWPKKE